jgi:GNAT superfamily N-acetyltransferase
VRIRRALLSDSDAIAALASELGYPSSSEQIRARLQTLLPRDSHFIAIAENGGSAAGWVAAEERMLLESGKRAEIVGLVVAVNARRFGIGRALVREAESWARDRGVETIGVRSNVVRPEAHPFYESLGYTRSKTQHAYSKRLASG